MTESFRDDIRKALGERLDPDTFEACAVSLLQKEWPTLVPVPGGSDGGMDGSFNDPKGRPGTLVVTTREDVLRNLRESLTARRTQGGKGSAIFATSRPVTPQLRTKLVAQAKRLGFRLLEIYEREAFVDRLVQSPEWCVRLLKLTGAPSALSKVPRAGRPVLGNRIVGRGTTLRWLRHTPGDKILLGQPGSGKTRLLARVAKTEGWMFVDPTSDFAQVAADVRRLTPTCIMVDDAPPEFLVRLRDFREKVNAKFSILAAGWPNDRSDLQVALGLTRRSTRRLGRLTREQLVRVLASAKFTSPSWLVREIVNQAEGRPGLAASLVHSVREGDGDAGVRRGEVLQRIVLDLARRFDPDAEQVLAGFALGGARGVSSAMVESALQRDPLQLNRMLRELKEGGVIRSAKQGDRYIVSPPALRETLVCRAFEPGMIRRQYEVLLEQASPLDCVQVLVIAKMRGGDVPLHVIEEVYRRGLKKAPKHRVELAAWFGHLGTEQAVDAIREVPTALTTEPRPFLENAPDIALDALLRAAPRDARELHSAPFHPLRIIQDWVCDHPGDVEQSLRRRETLLRVARRAAQQPELALIALRAACAAVNPSIHRMENDATDTRFTMGWGEVPREELLRMRPLWTAVQELLGRVGSGGWKFVLQSMNTWRGGLSLVASADSDRARETVLREVVLSFAALASAEPAVLVELRRLAEQIDLPMAVPIDADFELLVGQFHDLRPEDYEQRVDALSRTLEQWGPNDAADKVSLAYAHAAVMDQKTGAVWFAAHRLALRTSSAMLWAQAFASHAVWDLVGPFLHRAARDREPGWKEWAVGYVEDGGAAATLVDVALVAADAQSLFDVMLEQADAATIAKELGSSRGLLPAARMMRLLEHQELPIVVAALQREWNEDEQPDKEALAVRLELCEAWRAAALRVPVRANCFVLGWAFARCPELACDWLIKRLQDGDYFSLEHEYVAREALRVLSNAERRRIVDTLGVQRLGSLALDAIVNDDALFEYVLGLDPQNYRILSYRTGGAEGVTLLPTRINLALQRGVDAADLADCVFGSMWAYSGAESAYHQRWIDQFQCLADGKDQGLAAVGRAGLKGAEERRSAAQRRERRTAVLGRG